jgi:hypothetical protein
MRNAKGAHDSRERIHLKRPYFVRASALRTLELIRYISLYALSSELFAAKNAERNFYSSLGKFFVKPS